MTDVSEYGGSVAEQIDDPSGSGETSPDELNAVARENASRVERNYRRADFADAAAVSDDESLIEVPSRTSSPAPSPPRTPSYVDSSPSLATHPALQNFDIICTICSYVHHGTLAPLASTCRIFERPALDVLWRNLHSVAPLVRCLPSDLFGIDQGHMALLNPLDAKMWDILCKYTTRVYSITQSGRSAVIEALGSLMLSYPSASASLFPNLRKLTWHADGTHCAAEFLRMAFVPTHLFLDMRISSASPIFLSVLSSLGTLSPHLRIMTMKYPSATNDSLRKASPFIAQSISQLHHLRKLSIWDLGNQGMERLMQLRALQTLWLDLKGDRRSHLRVPGFHDLHSLTLCIDNLNHASDFLSSLQVIRSKGMTLRFTAAHPSASASTTLSQFFAVLQETCDHDNLESFALVGYWGQVHTKPGDFTPLHACRNLTRLLVENGCNISMADEELCTLVGAWPKLEVLAISRFVAINDTTMPTFRGLISLLRLCPALTSLTLVIDATNLQGIDFHTPGGGICNNHLESLILSNSPISSPLDVALFLSGLFPYLECVELDCWDSAPKNLLHQKQSAIKQWEAVNLFLCSFTIVRERWMEAL
ncbi:uncharacterized protein EDB91DRAFT_1217140 [Suillus paluster]|uniref:uncharacterized protein n=1 Tax=Suillus paluster TaxID=48578 RepID=UPI001B879DB7|nr:uncharacterized protein EDB91DRAFT_1217140 [Suillus paluster]KAG1750451.1 hypothetical protein EDB91DRAFT_1217140 [Suillus paluster]